MKKGRLETNLRTHNISLKGSRALLKWRWEQYQLGIPVMPSYKKRRNETPLVYLVCSRDSGNTMVIPDDVLRTLVFPRLVQYPHVLLECLFVSRQFYMLAHETLLTKSKLMFGNQFGTLMSYSLYLQFDERASRAPLSKLATVKHFWLKPNAFKNTPYSLVATRLVGAIHAEHGYVEHLPTLLRARTRVEEAKQIEENYVQATIGDRLKELNTLVANTAYGTKVQFHLNATVVDPESFHILRIMFMGGGRMGTITSTIKDYLLMETTMSAERILFLLLPYARMPIVFNLLYGTSVNKSFTLYYLLYMYYAPKVIVYGVELSELAIVRCVQEIVRTKNEATANCIAICEWNLEMNLRIYYVHKAELTWSPLMQHPTDPSKSSMDYFNESRIILHTRRQSD